MLNVILEKSYIFLKYKKQTTCTLGIKPVYKHNSLAAAQRVTYICLIINIFMMWYNKYVCITSCNNQSYRRDPN